MIADRHGGPGHDQTGGEQSRSAARRQVSRRFGIHRCRGWSFTTLRRPLILHRRGLILVRRQLILVRRRLIPDLVVVQVLRSLTRRGWCLLDTGRWSGCGSIRSRSRRRRRRRPSDRRQRVGHDGLSQVLRGVPRDFRARRLGRCNHAGGRRRRWPERHCDRRCGRAALASVVDAHDQIPTRERRRQRHGVGRRDLRLANQGRLFFGIGHVDRFVRIGRQRFVQLRRRTLIDSGTGRRWRRHVPLVVRLLRWRRRPDGHARHDLRQLEHARGGHVGAGPGVDVHAFDIGRMDAADVRRRDGEPDGHDLVGAGGRDLGRSNGQCREGRERRALLPTPEGERKRRAREHHEEARSRRARARGDHRLEHESVTGCSGTNLRCRRCRPACGGRRRRQS